METKRYHQEIGFPAWAEARLQNLLDGFDVLRYSTHAKYETIRDRYHIVPVIKKSDLRVEDVFEIEVEGNCIVKAVFRISGKGGYDNCYAVTGDGIVKTCWTNTKEDSHKTLDKGAYAQV